MKNRGICTFFLTITLCLFSGCGNEEQQNVGSQSVDVKQVSTASENIQKNEETQETQETQETVKEIDKLKGESSDTEQKANVAKETQTVVSDKDKVEQDKPDKDKPEQKANTTQTDATTESTGATPETPATTSRKSDNANKTYDTGASASGSASGSASSQSNPVAHSCTWDSGQVTTAATCNKEGVKTYTCTGCGKTKTESIPKTNHNYVTETTVATCTEGGGTTVSCTNCGDVKSAETSSGPLGHINEKQYAMDSPTCRNGAYYTLICIVCGANGGSGSDPRSPHTVVSTVITQGNCVVDTIIKHSCSVCGVDLGTDYHKETGNHKWETITEQIRNQDTMEMEDVEITYCANGCGQRK